MQQPLISILIPFYQTEDYLPACLESCAQQTYPNIEVIVVNDCSPQLGCAKQIVDAFSKKHEARKNFSVQYYEHEENKGTFETRRTCFEKSKGQYCFFLDSDDRLVPETLSSLFDEAESSKADIVQGTAEILYESKTSSENAINMKNNICLVHKGSLIGESICEDFLCHNGHSYLLWGKLYSSKIVRRALNEIPHFYGVLAEDFILYYFICQHASLYVGINKTVYLHNIDTGLTSGKQITDLHRWERICSTSSAFSVIYTYFENNPPPPKQKEAVQKFCWYSLLISIRRLKKSVSSEIYDDAYDMLCDYWGKSFVEKAESTLNDNPKV